MDRVGVDGLQDVSSSLDIVRDGFGFGFGFGCLASAHPCLYSL